IGNWTAHGASRYTGPSPATATRSTRSRRMAPIVGRFSPSGTSVNGGTSIFSARPIIFLASSRYIPRPHPLGEHESSFRAVGSGFLLHEAHVRHGIRFRNFADGTELRFIPADVLCQRFQNPFGMRRSYDHARNQLAL